MRTNTIKKYPDDSVRLLTVGFNKNMAKIVLIGTSHKYQTCGDNAEAIEQFRYVASTKGRLTLHFLPGYAPDLNPDELVWSHAKRTGVARRPLKKGEKLQDRVHEQLQKIGDNPKLVRSFFKHPSVAYISDL